MLLWITRKIEPTIPEMQEEDFAKEGLANQNEVTQHIVLSLQDDNDSRFSELERFLTQELYKIPLNAKNLSFEGLILAQGPKNITKSIALKHIFENMPLRTAEDFLENDVEYNMNLNYAPTRT